MRQTQLESNGRHRKVLKWRTEGKLAFCHQRAVLATQSNNGVATRKAHPSAIAADVFQIELVPVQDYFCMQARDAGIIDYKLCIGVPTKMNWQLVGGEKGVNIQPRKCNRIRLGCRSGKMGHIQGRRHGEEIRQNFALPFHPVHHAGFGTPPKVYGSETAKTHQAIVWQMVDHRLRA